MHEMIEKWSHMAKSNSELERLLLKNSESDENLIKGNPKRVFDSMVASLKHARLRERYCVGGC